jgi:site-specific recombinase XerD
MFAKVIGLGQLLRRRPRGWPLEAFEAHLSVSMAPGSVATRRCAVELFARTHPDPWAVDRHQVEAYLAGKSAGAYRRSCLASLRAFYRWSLECGWVGADPTALVRLGRARVVQAPTCDEVTYRRALRDAPDEATRLMVELAGRVGLRAMEVASTRGDRISADGLWLTVHGKGGKDRRVPLPPPVRDAIMARGPGWTFPGGRGREQTHVTAGSVGKRLSALLGPAYSGHSLRHRAATRAYAAGHDVNMVARVLGHESIATTQAYLGLSDDDVWSAWVGATG